MPVTPLTRLPLGPGLLSRAAAYRPWSTIERHEHPWAFIALVTGGTVHEVCDGRPDVRGHGAVRIMPAGLAHANSYVAGGARCFITELDETALDLPPAARDVLAAPSVHPSGSPVGRLAAAMHAEYRHADDLSPLAVNGLLQELLAAAGRASRAAASGRAIPQWLLRVRERIHDTCPAAPTLRALAEEAGVHPGHLVRAFREHFHTAPAEYMARLRVARACDALERTDAPLAEVALTAGYCDQAHFTRRFKALVGTTPARYRRERR